MAHRQLDQRGRTRHRGWWLLSASLVVAGTLHLYAEESVAEEPVSPPPAVQDEMEVGIEYTLTVEGEVIDSTEGREAFHYVQGRQQIIPGLERKLAGLQVGDRRYVVVKPEDGYGELDPEAFVEVPTGQVFTAFDSGNPAPALPRLPEWTDVDTFSRTSRNDLQEHAVALCPDIAVVLAELSAQSGAAMARMSGSGATCFALFDTPDAAIAAADAARLRGWWAEAAEL